VAFDKLLSPIMVGSTAVRNRVVITSHGASELFRNPAQPAAPYIEYMRRRAAGGVGLIIAQPLYPNPFSAFPDEIRRRHAALAAAVRDEGAVVLLQLAHLGVFGRTESDPRRPPLWSFDHSQSDAGEACHKMTDGEVEQMVEAYRRAAVLAAQAGFHGVEVHGGHGYLIQQALTPRWNSRTDRWGSDRTLFAREIIAAAREVFGPEGIVGYRTATDDFRSPEDGGRGAAGIAEDLKAILGTGQVDLLNTTVGDGGKSYYRAIPSYRFGEGPNIPFLTRLRQLVEISVPVIGVGHITSPSAAEALLNQGSCDLVAMTRAHIADPDIVAKTRAGHGSRIRPCVGATVCVDRKLAGFADISCFHNPEVLRETELDPAVRAQTRRRVMIVGAGPAGLKAAEVAARRGHHVDIYDQARTVGGRLRAAEHTSGAQLLAAIDYLLSELSLTDATLHLGTTVDAELVARCKPDEVLVATGTVARPAAVSFDGGETGRVVTSAEALNDADIDGDVLVYDRFGTIEAALVAEELARRGCQVVFATPFEVVIPHAGHIHRSHVPELLAAKTRGIHTGALVGYVDGEVVLLVRPAGETLAEIKASTIVVVEPGLPRLELVPALQRAHIPYRIVGDAVAPRSAWAAFNDGLTAALAL
jgi:2,4-dienoyl-CoA reductase-like NADH-dependent reductase (Old Yellow Enzyme family)